MKQIIIENPVLNSAFNEPDRHFRFTEEGITDEIIDARRVSAINNHGGFGRWTFLEITDPWDAKNTMRTFLRRYTETEQLKYDKI